MRMVFSQPPIPQTLPPGYRFSPTVQELVQFYLYPKVTNSLSITSAPVRDCDIYDCQPPQIWNDFHRIQGEDVFFFTNLKSKSPTPRVSRQIAGGPTPRVSRQIAGGPTPRVSRQIAGGQGTWHREDTGQTFDVAIDEHCSVKVTRKCFSYQSTQPGQHGCGWTMYEYSLPLYSEVIVLCQLRRKDDNKSHTQTTKKRRRQADGVDDATNTISQKARVGEGYHQQQVTGFEAAAETESDQIVYNGLRFDNFESFCRLLVEDFDNDQMGVSSVASPIKVAAPSEEPSATPEADEVHSTPKGSTPVESLATDADGYHLDAQVSGSSLSSRWRGSLSQQLLQSNPTCLVQENEVEMISYPFGMESPYGVSSL